MSGLKRRFRRNDSSSKALRSYGEELLNQADAIWRKSDLLDTAVRDGIAEGLGHVVHAAYDCIATSMNIQNIEGWCAWIDNATAEWFRQRGFAEWFCAAAAQSFRTSRPRILEPDVFPIRKRKARKRVA